MEKRIEQIIEFLRIIDQFKSIERKTKVSHTNRHENDAEHTWHMCMFALLLHKEIEEEINFERILKLILIHDLGEIYAGDTYAHDSFARINKKERETEAIQKLLNELPNDLKVEFHELWNEYEANETQEAQFVQAIDKMQAFTQNVHTNGEVWKENKVTSNKIIKFNENWTKQNKTFEDLFGYLWKVAESKKMFYTKKED
ncbi:MULTISPECIES: HD family hydrolase [unclassified Bacillus (in: firmicutes)]|uniref:HD domain-containing protein n=1 Tax=unclassified Bacillus (in: firmicutes) TaxID=185979 RepID=UPI0008F1759B|nr:MULTISPECIES: HD domain-containing protein [unclassified Bacillus (in: firmicutes)]SFI76697.1 putative hydrolases of HD superfamily [Bacillus sp. 71mf]SFS87094.1 putative hydrolases of HD superfamily [Bacillus sp. 103mf]